jgi:hypothetical protein
MTRNENGIIYITIAIIGAIVVLISAGMGILFVFGEKNYPRIIESVQSEYSVPIEVRVINTSEGLVPYIVPGYVKWDEKHTKLLYNLSNHKEAVLAIQETLKNSDAQAFDNLMSENFKNYWTRKGYNTPQIIETLRANYKDIDKPYVFGLEQGEGDPSMGILSVKLIRDSGENEFQLNLELDGTWKI